jgi:tetratricopeptide (TPR) repeat protein
LLVLIIALVIAAAAPARAAEGDPRDQAAAHYTRGIDLAQQGRYEAALEQFTHAYTKSPHFAVLYNIGQAHIALGRPVEAIEALTTYLREGADRVPLSRREQVQAQIALLESKLAELTISTDRPGVAIRVDNRDLGRTPLFQPIRLAAGTHAVTASVPNGAQIARVVTLAEAERQRLELAFAGETPAKAAAADTAVVVPAASPVTPSDSGAIRRTAYVVAGLGAAAAGAALGVYLWNRNRYDDWKAGNAALEDLTFGSAAYWIQATANNELATSLTRANQAIVGLSIVSGVLIATGGWLWFADRPRGRAAGEVTFLWTGSAAQLGWSRRW